MRHILPNARGTLAVFWKCDIHSLLYQWFWGHAEIKLGDENGIGMIYQKFDEYKVTATGQHRPERMGKLVVTHETGESKRSNVR